MRQRERTSALLRRLAGEGPLAIVTLTIYEVVVGAREHELRRTWELLDSLVVLPIGAAEARLAAELARDRGPGLVDCHSGRTAAPGAPCHVPPPGLPRHGGPPI